MKNEDNKKEKRAEVGSFKAIIELTKELFKFRKDLPKRDEKRQITKIDIIAVILTIVIVVLIGVVLWFIPFTNGFMRELMFWSK
jgi:uncharacterized membrane protein